MTTCRASNIINIITTITTTTKPSLSRNPASRPCLIQLFLPLILFLTLPTPILAADSLEIYNSSTTYRYAGCWNETTDIAGSANLRALDGGTSETLDGAMTVPLCLGFCHNGGAGAAHYRFAGLEYSRECWCAAELSALSVRLPDGDCDTACDGDGATACGGSLRLSLYQLNAGARVGGALGMDLGRMASMIAAAALAATSIL